MTTLEWILISLLFLLVIILTPCIIMTWIWIFGDVLESIMPKFKQKKEVINMKQYIDKAAVVAEIEKRIADNKRDIERASHKNLEDYFEGYEDALVLFKEQFLDNLEVKDPYEQCVQYDSIKAGIQAHAEDYSFNIESELFNQLTKEQQALWRKEIEYACISGGDAGYLLAKDPRYKENLEVKEVDLKEEYEKYYEQERYIQTFKLAKHFFELGLSVNNKAQKGG